MASPNVWLAHRTPLFSPLFSHVQITGEQLPYVTPPSFDDAYEYLTEAVRTKDLGREYKKVFIDGPSGSGKTRVVWELYRRLQSELSSGHSSLHIGAVSYVYINLTDSFLPETMFADDSAVQRKLALYIISQLSATSPSGQGDITLDGVLASLFGGKRGALVLHIDEFHRHPAETVRLLSVVRAYSVREISPAVILAACTGLYTDPSFDPSKVSSIHRRVPLGFFRDHQKTWEIVRGAGLALTGAAPMCALCWRKRSCPRRR